jgi:hypothetical protein
MTWNPAREEWSHEPLTHDEWESLTPSEQAFYEEPLQDTFEVDLKDLARLQPDFAAGLRDEISKVFQVPAQLLQPRNDNQSVSEGGGSKQN